MYGYDDKIHQLTGMSKKYRQSTREKLTGAKLFLFESIIDVLENPLSATEADIKRAVTKLERFQQEGLFDGKEPKIAEEFKVPQIIE